MSKETKKMTKRTFIAVLAAGICLLGASPSALGAAPALKLTAASETTNFVADADATAAKETFGPLIAMPQYNLVATNIGSVATSGPVVFTDTLPAAVTPLTAAVFRDRERNEKVFPCNVSGQTVTCTDPNPLQPGEWAQFVIPLKVDANASATITNQASIVGGGAAEARTSTTTTISSSLPSFGFLSGNAGFSAAVTTPQGQPATQAGSHPYSMTFDLGFPTVETGNKNQRDRCTLQSRPPPNPES